MTLCNALMKKLKP